MSTESRAPESLPTILVVDDDEQLARVVGKLARRTGVRVQVATSVRAALALAASERIELLICDVHMPELHGHQLVAELQAQGTSCPVLFISGDSSLSTVEDSLRMPRALFLPKPFSDRELSAAIWAALSQR